MPQEAVGGGVGDKKETVAVLGLGRLGLCFAVVLEQAGYKVVFQRLLSPIEGFGGLANEHNVMRIRAGGRYGCECFDC